MLPNPNVTIRVSLTFDANGKGHMQHSKESGV
jgi:hypothetical protein